MLTQQVGLCLVVSDWLVCDKKIARVSDRDVIVPDEKLSAGVMI